MEDLSGQVLKGYELHKLIGQGGLGAVYRATQPQVGREVAIKIILPQFANHPDFIRRFEFEAQLVARLEHPHIVPLYDFWREPDGAYLVMRLLRRSVRESLTHSGPWDLEPTVYLLDQIAAALTVAHRNGVIHRDMKPDNILLDEDGNAYLADFGIAKDLQLDGSGLDEDGDTVVGSPAYLSPEQIKSEPVMPQTDLYGLGIVLYEVLTGEHPFGSVQSTDMLYKHLNESLPVIKSKTPHLLPELDSVLQRATAKDPAARYSSALSMAAAFRQVAALAQDVHITTDTRSFAVSILEERTPSGSMDAPEPENPYKGLRPFVEADANHFFGREMLTIQLLGRLSEPGEYARFLAVVGPSGSGKTSAVRAGLIPALRIGALPGSQDWFTLEMLPGSHPISQLETLLQSVAVNPLPNLSKALREDNACLSRIIRQALPGSGESQQLVLILDQFEALFTGVEDEDERARFLHALQAALTVSDSCLYVIVTLRADHYDRPLRYPEFGEMMRRRTEVVLPLSGSDLERAIVGPAESVQVGLEPGLVEMIKADVGMQPGALPLLQYALTELFERREGRRLTREAYQSIGGVLGALAQRAEDLYSDLDETGREAARQLLLRLSSTQGARHRVPQEELTTLGGNPEAIQHVLDTFGKSRLLTFDRDPATRQPTVEVAHEALLWEWGRLQGWIDASREDVRRQRRMREAVADWLAAERDPSYLATGRRLEELETWATRTDLALNRQEEAYLYASLARRETELAKEEARQKREARLRRRNENIMKMLLGVLLLSTLGALGLSAFALRARDKAHHAMSTAESARSISMTNEAIAAYNEVQARSLALAASAQLAFNQKNSSLAIMLGLHANALPDPPPQAQWVLAQAAYSPAMVRRLEGHNGDVNSAAFGPSHRALTGSADGTLLLWDLKTGAIVRRLESGAGPVWDVAISPDGTQALSASEDGTVLVWDLTDGEIVHRLAGHDAAVRAAAFVPALLETDGTAYEGGMLALTGGLDRTLILWNVQTGELVRRFEGHRLGINDIAVSQAGPAALTGSVDGTAVLWDLATGEILTRSAAYDTEVASVALSPDGHTAAAGLYRGDIVLWNLHTGSELRRMQIHGTSVWGLAFTPDGKRLLSGSDDADMALWDVESGQILHHFRGAHYDSIFDVAIAPDGRLALSAGDRGDVVLWDIASGAEIQRLTVRGKVDSLAIGPSGHVVFSTDAGHLYLWGGSESPPRLLVKEPETVGGVAFGLHDVLYGTDGGDVVLWDTMSHAERLRLEGHAGAVRGVAFGPGERTALSGAADGEVIFWDVEAGAIIKRLQGHTGAVWSVAIGPEGRLAVSGAGDNNLILWNLESLEPIGTIAGHEGPVRSVAISPDGRTAISGSFDSTLILWSLETCAPLRRFLGHSAPVFAAAFSPDGQMIASGDVDSTLIIWDVASGQPIRTLTGHTAGVWGVAFSSDGHTLLSGARDGTLRRWWAHSAGELVAWTRENRSLYIRELNCFERERYGLEPCPPGTLPAHTP